MSTNQVKVGWRAFSSTVSGTDTDAQAFITAAGITDSTQQSAINTLVTQLKTYGIWTKMKALYPFVGGSATSHKFNLKDPRDLDAAYRLTFSGGWTHSSTGAKPNGTTGYANTFINTALNFTSISTSNHLSIYLRENKDELSCPIGNGVNPGVYFRITPRYQNIAYNQNNVYNAYTQFSNTDSRGFWIDTRQSNLVWKHLLNGEVKSTASSAISAIPNCIISLGATYNASLGAAEVYSSNEQAFASIGDGLTDTEAAAFYTAVQTFQTTLGRQVGVPIVADADAQAFLNAAIITDQTQANAVTTLVTDLKSANIWSKMKALYPMVGGSATTHKFNLKDPRDLDAAFRLQFNGGWTHTSTGALPNGTTGYADTKLIPSSTLNLNSTHLSVYLNTNYASSVDVVDMGVEDASYTNRLFIEPSTIGNVYSNNNSNGNSYINTQDLNSLGLYVNNRISSTAINLFKNSIKIINDTARTSSALSVRPLYIGAHNFVGSASYLSPRRQAFASIGDGLTDAEAAAFYTAVQKYQTTLGRQV